MTTESLNDERWTQTLATLAVVALILAVFVSVVPLFYLVAPFVGFIVLGESRVRRAIGRSEWMMPLVAFAIANLIAFGIYTIAYLAPVKTTDRFLERSIRLPAPRLSLGEIAGSPHGLPPEWYPRSVGFSVPDNARQDTVTFPATTITLRQFVNVIEDQTELRHRFAHCGNGSTILWGGDCSMGLHFWRPRELPPKAK